MDKAKNIYTILKNIDFDGTCKYIDGRTQMINAGLEFNVQEYLFAFTQKFYEEGLKHNEQLIESVLLENEHLSFELNELTNNLKSFNEWLSNYKATCKRMSELLKNNNKIGGIDNIYLKAKIEILEQFELAIKQNNLKL